MGNASQINRSRDSVRVERRSDLNESDLGEVYCICIFFIFHCNDDFIIFNIKCVFLCILVLQNGNGKTKLLYSAMSSLRDHSRRFTMANMPTPTWILWEVVSHAAITVKNLHSHYNNIIGSIHHFSNHLPTSVMLCSACRVIRCALCHLTSFLDGNLVKIYSHV